LVAVQEVGQTLVLVVLVDQEAVLRKGVIALEQVRLDKVMLVVHRAVEVVVLVQ
jgi:hypothetical protein